MFRVTDGDTFKFDDKIYRVQGIDCPEYGKKPKNKEEENQFFWGKIASITTFLLLNEHPIIEIKNKYKDKYGRIVARVKLNDGSDLGETLVSEGLAKVYRKYLDSSCENAKQLIEAEEVAKENNIGIWNLNNPLLIDPWEFRKLKG
jgi:micrococcal nuclease